MPFKTAIGAVLIQPGIDANIGHPLRLCIVILLGIAYLLAYSRTSRMTDAAAKQRMEHRLLITTIIGSATFLIVIIFLTLKK